jgi:hypothetical protein
VTYCEFVLKHHVSSVLFEGDDERETVPLKICEDGEYMTEVKMT